MGGDTLSQRPAFQLVQQRNGGDCGVACVAMIAGTDYETAGAAFKEFGSDGRWTDGKALSRALVWLGVRSAKRMVPIGSKTVLDIGRDAIIRVNEVHGRWHWIVWDGDEKRVLDPMPRPRRRYRAAAYLPVFGRANRLLSKITGAPDNIDDSPWIAADRLADPQKLDDV